MAHASNPFRSPQWRWQRAQELVEAGRYYSKKREDPHTGSAMHYLQAWRRYDRDGQLTKLAEQYPDLDAARQLFEEGGFQQVELEARILARQSVPEIAQAMQLTPGSIEAYQAVFFDVRERIGANVYILQLAIGMPPTGPVPLAALVKTSAYLQGPLVLDAWLDFLAHADDKHDLATPEGRRRAWLGLTVAIHSLPADEKTNRKLITLAPLLFGLPSKIPHPRTVAQAFVEKTQQIAAQLVFRHGQGPALGQPPAEACSSAKRTGDVGGEVGEAA